MTDISEGIQFRRDGVDPTQWPKLSCSQANQTALELSDLRLDAQREILFQGNGQLNASGDILFITGGTTPEKLRILANGNVGIGTSSPAYNLDVNGILNVTEIYKNGAPWKLTTNEITDNAITATKIQDGSVGQAELSVGAVTELKIANNAVTEAKLANNAVTALKIADGNVSTAKLADGAVNGLKIALGAVSTDKLGDGAVTLAKLEASVRPVWSSGSSGSIFYNSGNVGIGTTNPTNKLHIVGTGSVTIENKGEADILFSDTSSGQAWQVGTNVNGWYVYDNAYRLVVKQGSGNVGIGTTTPDANLYVYTTTKNGGNNTACFYAPNIGSNASHIHWGTTGDWYIRSAASNGKVIVQDNGGSTFIGGGLAVNGRMSVSDGVIQKGGSPITSTRDLGLYSQEPGYWMRFVTTPGSGGVPGFWFFCDGGSGNKVVAQIDGNGRYTQSSSWKYKENIEVLSNQDAFKALEELNPVLFNYKLDDKKRRHVGFIAEELPNLVADPKREMLSPTDIIAVLTKVVKEQQNTIAALTERVQALEIHNS